MNQDGVSPLRMVKDVFMCRHEHDEFRLWGMKNESWSGYFVTGCKNYMLQRKLCCVTENYSYYYSILRKKSSNDREKLE